MSTSSQGALVPPIPSVPRYNPRSFRIAQLLQANETPSPQELSELRRTVAEAPQNIINLGQRIEATRELLDDLITQQSYASDALDDARFITHSPRQLPEDVLLEIFYHCVNEVVEALRAGQMRCVLHCDVAPLSLSQVCQSWRRVTIQAPLLWRCVSVNLHNHYVTREHHAGAPYTNHDDPRSSYLLCIHLQRARQVPLHVCINGRDNFAQISLIPPLLSTSSAWVQLSLRLPFSAYHQLATCHGFLDRLQFLRLSVKDHANFDGIIAPTEAVSAFSIAPQLREVRCDDLRNARNFFAFPPDGVKIFSSRADSKEDLASLTLLPTVKDLSLHCYVDSFPQDLYAQWTAQGPSLIRPNPYRTLDSVTSLHMHQHVNGPQALARLYSALNLPSLSYLHFHFENYAQGYDLPIVSDSNRHTVTTLELTGRLEIEQGIHSIYDFLRSFPNLRHLILRIKDVPASLYVLLTYHPQLNHCDHLNMLPRLEILELPIATISVDNIFQRFVEMVRSRSVTRYGRDDHRLGDPLTCAKLKEVQVGFGRVVFEGYLVRHSNPGHSARLDEAIADGLVLRDREAVSGGRVGGQLVSEE